LGNKKAGVYIILASVIASIVCFSIGTKTSKLTISPLIGWLLFAMLMNAIEVQNK
jgi:predicted Kef-type K+ transport protein